MRRGPHNQRPLLNVDKLTRTPVKRYENANQCAEELGVSWSTVYGNARKKMLPIGRWYYRFEDKFDPNEDFGTCRNKPMVVYDTVSGKRWAVPDSTWIAEKFGIKKTSVIAAMSEGHIIKRRFKVSYLK